MGIAAIGMVSRKRGKALLLFPARWRTASPTDQTLAGSSLSVVGGVTEDALSGSSLSFVGNVFR